MRDRPCGGAAQRAELRGQLERGRVAGIVPPRCPIFEKTQPPGFDKTCYVTQPTVNTSAMPRCGIYS